MTCIARFATKKDFRAAVETLGAEHVVVEDPSIFAPFRGSLFDYMSVRESATFTNHPKRSWFALVRRTRDGALRIS